MTSIEDSPNFSSEITRFLTRIPASQRESVMARILANLESEKIPSIKAGDKEPDHNLPLDQLSWIQRLEAREKPVNSIREKRAQVIQKAWDSGQYNLLDSDCETQSIFQDYVQRTAEKHGEDAAKELVYSTSQLMSSSLAYNDAVFAYNQDFNGLVVGSIQSGKSASFLGLVSSSIDQGVKVVVVLSGVTDKLRNQTQKRLDSDIIKHCSDRVYSPTTFGDLSRYRKNNKTSQKIWGPLKASCVSTLRQDGGAVVIVTKKNHATLKALDTLLSYLDSLELLGDQPVLMVDDECDHSSINTSSELFDGVTNVKGPTIHKAIVGLRTKYPMSYWGYTATPQSQVFMHPNDALAPLVAHLLESHKYYLGPLEVFQEHKDLLVDPCHVTDFNLPKKGEDIIKELKKMKKPPESMVQAMINHAVSGAIHHLQKREFMPHGFRHSMMVHICREIKGQAEVYRLVNLAKTDALQRLTKAQLGPEELVEQSITRFRTNRRKLRMQHSRIPNKSNLLEKAIEVLNQSAMRLLNSASDDTLDYEDPETPDNLIIIGGDILSRGLTIEGLRTTYFLREPSKILVDSTLQTARWFGPLREDKDMISIHLRPTLARRFAQIAWDDASLRDELRLIAELDLSVCDARITNHPGYHATAKNKRRNGEAKRFAGDRVSIDSPWIGTTGDAVKSFKQSLEDLGGDFTPIRSSKNALQGIKRACTLSEMVKFLEQQTISSRARIAMNDALGRLKLMIQNLPEGGVGNIVIRNGSAESMDTELPASFTKFGLNRVIRSSKDNKKVDQLASGKTPNQSQYTSDWWLDGFRPTTPTANARGWRTTDDPVILLVYVIDSHPDKKKLLRGAGPWIGFALQFPHVGPGGSYYVNKHSDRGEEE